MSRPGVVLGIRPPRPVLQKLQEYFQILPEAPHSLSGEEIVSLVNQHQASGILLSVNQKLPAHLIRELSPSLKIIATASAGFDHIDLIEAKKRSIIVTHAPQGVTHSTADLTLMLMLNVLRRAREYAALMQEGWGRFLEQDELLGMNPEGKSLGILGMGKIGRQVAHRARAFGMKILYCDPVRLSPSEEKDARFFSSFEDMIPNCDVLSLHAPANPKTFQIMNTQTFGLMKKGSIFINAARGSLVNEEALLNALDQKRLFGAGIDVFANEPHLNQRLLDHPNVFLTPHIGASTVETRNETGLLAVENLIAVLEGKSPISPVLQ